MWKTLVPLGVLAIVLAALGRKPDAWEYADGPEAEEVVSDDTPQVPHVARRRPAARFALAAAFTTLFFAGASFTAGAGDQMAQLLDDDAVASAELDEIEAARTDSADTESTEAMSAEAAPAEVVTESTEESPAVEETAAVPAEPAAAEPAATEVAAVEEAVKVAAAPEPLAAEVADAALAPATIAAPAPSSVIAPAPEQVAAPATPVLAPTPVEPAVSTKKWVVRRAAEKPARAPEIEHAGDGAYGEPTIWLNRSLPDPTPASARLARSFARELKAASARHGADWAAVLGVLRAQGERGSVPATPAELDTLAARLAGGDAWKGALAVSGRTAFADRASALADLYRAVGLEALVTGFAKAKDRLAEKLLATEGVLIYGGGRSDIEAGRIDVRLIVLISYLAERHGSVTVSSLFSGHRKYARPGVVSAHTYGHAVDIAAIGGTPIAGHQQPGGETEEAVRSVLLLPAELQPQQVISLLGLGGPSFPLRDHGDHIHIGY
ncbi:MAG: hypothetical protein M3R12_05735 [Actinomycetota bacterium]|nr:hypothetical protein [Actinomycetota bacterium]